MSGLCSMLGAGIPARGTNAKATRELILTPKEVCSRSVRAKGPKEVSLRR